MSNSKKQSTKTPYTGTSQQKTLKKLIEQIVRRGKASPSAS